MNVRYLPDLTLIPFESHLEMSRGLNFPDGLHERVADDDLNIGAGVFVRLLRQLLQVLLGEDVRGVAEMDLEHGEARVLLRQRDVDSLLEASPDG